MQFTRLWTLAIFALLVDSGASQAAIITVKYTGSFSGNWVGNYDPVTNELANLGLSSGSYSATPFTLTFTFNTDLAQPGYFDASHLYTPPKDPFYNYPSPPSVGSALFRSSLFNLSSGNFSAFHIAYNQTTSQHTQEVLQYRYGNYTATVFNMTAQGTYVPESITEPFRVSSDRSIGYGDVDYNYIQTSFGGGNVHLFLTAYTLDVTVDGVPEPSTWAMLLIGFAGLGYVARRHANRATAHAS